MLEKFSYENRAESRPGWLPLAFHEAGVAWDVIFGVFDELLTAKVSLPSFLLFLSFALLELTVQLVLHSQVPPWHTPAGLTFLASDAAVLLETWLAESSSSHVASPYAVASSFPATEVDTAVGKWLMGLASASSAAGVVAKLQEVQREVRRRY